MRTLFYFLSIFYYTFSSVGSASALVHLEVHEAPVITMKPRSEVNVNFGESVSLECSSLGSPTPILIWMHEKDRTVLLPGNFEVVGPWQDFKL